MRRVKIPFTAFFMGSVFIAGLYFGLLTLAQGWDSTWSLFLQNRWYVMPIWFTFGIQAGLYSVLRLGLLVPARSRVPAGSVMGASGSTSLTAMAACCLHHVTDVVPVLGLSAVSTFLTRYQRPFMLLGLGMNILGILIILLILGRERRKLETIHYADPTLEIA